MILSNAIYLQSLWMDGKQLGLIIRISGSSAGTREAILSMALNIKIETTTS